MATNNSTPQASLPGGTGLTTGLGEAMRLDLNTGQAVYSLPIKLPKGRAGLEPPVRLEYSASRRNGQFGIGWDMPLRAIHRRLDYGVPHDEFGATSVVERYLEGDLELSELADGSFGPMIETAFNRYERTLDGWRVLDRSGVRHEFGLTAAGRVSDPDHPDRTVSWLLERTTDTSGNTIEYSYSAHVDSPGAIFLSAIDYAAYRIVFDYEPRPDVLRDGRAGFLQTLTRRCQQISVRYLGGGADRLLRSWQIGYVQDPTSGASMLSTLIAKGHKDGLEDSLPAVTMTYRPFDASGGEMHQMTNDGAAPPSLADPDVAVVALDATPLPGVLQVRDGVHTYWPNRDGHTLGAPRVQRNAPNVTALGRAGAQLFDVDGNGTADLMVTAGAGALSGFYRNGGAEGWVDFVAYPRGSGVEPPWAAGARPVDFDSDGVVDALAPVGASIGQWENRGAAGWAAPTVRRVPTVNGRRVDIASPLVRLADMTGDGLADLVELRSGGVHYWPSLGHGRFGDPILMLDSPRLTGISDDPGSVQLVDLTGDGTADLVAAAGGQVTVWTNRSGNGFGAGVIHKVLPILPGSVRVADITGSGRASLAYSTLRRNETPMVTLTVGAANPYRLTAVDNGQGMRSDLQYGSSVAQALRDRDAGEPWTGFLPFPMIVITGTTETDAVSGRVAATDYRYHDGRYDPITRIFSGFSRVEQIERGDASRPDRTTVHHYAHGQAQAALNRLLTRVEVQAEGDDGHPVIFRREETAYVAHEIQLTADGARRHFVVADEVRVAWPDATADERTEVRQYQYDAFANVTREQTTVGGRRDGVLLGTEGWVVESSYAHNVAAHVHDKPARVTRRAQDGTLLGEILHHYDGADFVGLPLGQVDRGLQSRKRQVVLRRVDFDAHYGGADPADFAFTTGQTVDGDDAVFQETDRVGFDARGLVVAEMNGLGDVTTKVWDDDGVFAIRKVGPLGVTVLEVDHNAGEPSRIVDADGSEVVTSYDGLGRMRTVILPGDTAAEPTRAYSYDTTAVPVVVRATYRRLPGAGADATMQMATYYDGGGQEVQRRVEHQAAKIVTSSWKVPNSFGDVVEEYEPTFEPTLDFTAPVLAGRPSRRFEYDAEGRTLRTVNFNGATSELTIAPFEITLADPVQRAAGVVRREELDVRHRRVLVDEPAPGASLITRYQIGELGELLEAQDQHGPMVTYSYDMVGNRLVVTHREAGARFLFPDASGRVVATRDGVGNEIQATFDDAGRVAVVRSNGVDIETYTYDPNHQGGLGRLARVTYPGGAQSYTYTPRGQTSRVAYEFGLDPVVSVEYEYDGFGNETLIRHPDGTEVRTDYFTNGWVRSVPGFVDAITYDERGMPHEVRYTNGVRSETTLTAGIGRVGSRRVLGPAATVLDDLSYTHDDLDRVETSTDHRAGSVRTMTYDLLHQLSTVDDDGEISTYGYDGRDMTTNAESGVSLVYGDAAAPGRVTAMVTNGGAPQAIASDANGAIVDLAGRTLSYDSKTNLVRVENGGTTVEIDYDHRGERVEKRVTTGPATTTTRFVGDRTEISGGTTVVHVSIGGWRIAIKRATETRWIHSDELGSCRFFSNEAGQRVDGITIRPFGNVVGASATVTPRFFAMHPFDAETGLYYARRRYYSAELGRWITPDGLYLLRPETDEGEPKTLALYAYVANDPVNYVDPMGRSIWTVLGGIVGVIVGIALAVVVIAAFATGIGFGILALVGVALLIGAGYAGVSTLDPTSGFGEFMQGFLIGVNAGLNGVLAGAIFGPVIGIALGVINFLAVFDDVRTNPVYQGILGWSNFVQPMSWLVVGLGLVFFVLSLLGHVLYWISGGNWTFFQITGFRADWRTGSFGTQGGWIANLAVSNGTPTAFNMGNFIFINAASPSDHFEHEIGHNLNLAVMGSAVHFAGALDENVFGGGVNALTEIMAESHDGSRPGRPILPGWWR